MSPRKRIPGRRTITVSSRAWRALRNAAREPEILAELGTKTITATLQAVIDKIVLEEVLVLKRIIRQRRGLEPTGIYDPVPPPSP
jgi:hypothetical protein